MMARLRCTALQAVIRYNTRSVTLEKENAVPGPQSIPSDVALQESEERFRATFDHAPVGIAHVAVDGRWLLVNQKLCDILGYTQAELHARSFQDITHPDDLEGDLALVQQMLAGTIADYVTEKRYIRKDGSIVWTNLTVSLVREPDGAPKYFISVVEDIEGRKQAEARLQTSEQRASTLINALPYIAWMLDEDGHVVFFNQRWYEFTGRPDPETHLLGWLEAVHPDDRAELAARRSQAIAAGTEYGFEVRLRGYRGEYCWHLARVVPLRDETGTLFGWHGSAVEIDERKRIEQDHRFLAEASRILASSLDYETTLATIARLTLPHLADWCSIDIVDDGGTIRRLAVAHADPAKVSFAEQLRQRYPAEPSALQGVSAVVRTGEPLLVSHLTDAELAAATPDKELLQIWRSLGLVSLMIVPLIVRERVLGTISFVSAESGRRYNDGDLRQAQELAQRAAFAVDNAKLFRQAQVAQARLAFLAEASSVLAQSLEYEVTLDAVAHLAVPQIADYCLIDTLDEDQQVRRLAAVHVDPGKVELIQASRRFPPQPGSPLYEVLHTGQPHFVPIVTDAFLALTAVSDEHMALIRALGPTSVMVVPLTMLGQTMGAISLARVSDSKHYNLEDFALAQELARRAALAVNNARLYHAAQEAVREREALLGIASHELKNPLTPIWSYSQIMQRRWKVGAVLTERDLHAVQVISEQASRLTAMLDGLLDVSRLDHGQLSIDYVPVDVAALTQRLVDHLQGPLQDEGRHTLAYNGPPIPLRVLGDAVRLEQVLRNLITNAIKYSPQGGLISVTLAPRGSDMCVMVSDRGIGIPQEAIPKLFNRFYRAPNSEEQSIQGFGIGLYVVKEIVTRHGGTIEVQSVEGEGSTFSVCLPLHENSSSAAA